MMVLLVVTAMIKILMMNDADNDGEEDGFRRRIVLRWMCGDLDRRKIEY